MILIIDELLKYQDKVDNMDYNTAIHDISTAINIVTNKPTNIVSGHDHLQPQIHTMIRTKMMPQLRTFTFLTKTGASFH